MKMKINEIIRISELENHYESNAKIAVKSSIKKDKLKEPVIVNTKKELVHGYTRTDVYMELGYEEIEVIVQDVPASLYEYTIRNTDREKTAEDELKDIKVIFENNPKQQGKRNTGTPYVWHENIAKATNYKYKDEESIRNLDYVLKNDLEGNVLMKAHLKYNEPLSACVEFLKKNMKIDLDNDYGNTAKVVKGTLRTKEANKLIQKRYHNEKNGETFVIPDKSYAFLGSCLEIIKLIMFHNFVDLLFTSIPYYKLRSYDSPITDQLGHEATKEKFAENISLIIKGLIPTLKQSANVMINVGETYVNGLGLDIPNLVKQYILQNTNLIYKETIIWQKKNPGYHREYDENRPINCTEYILWFVVDPKKAKYKTITYKLKNNSVKIDAPKDKQYRSFWNFIEEQTVENVLKTSVGKNHEIYKIYDEGHPALMTPLLPLVPILMCTEEITDVVFDPFSGANTVSRMAAMLNRKTLSTEISKKYFSIGCEYLKQGIEQFDQKSLNEIQERFYQSNNKLINAA